MVVQHNLQAMNANRMLGLSSKSIAGSTEKLSSGYQINRAADNAAGLAISEKMRKQIRGLSRASENSEDGISCVQTAEGALSEVEDMLQRMNELCIQAANGTNSVNDRQYIQDEIDQLISEVDRVSETTKFNDTYLLKGDDKQQTSTQYIVNYSVTFTKNITSNATDENVLSYKASYVGENNIYIVSNNILGNYSGEIPTDKIQKGDDITEYMVKTNSGDNAAGATLNIKDYAVFINVELDSRVVDGSGGSVNSQVYSDISTTVSKYDLSTNGTDDTIRANKDLYVYDTATSGITKVTTGSNMSQYLNADNTLKDRYHLVDVLSAAKDLLNGAAGGVENIMTSSSTASEVIKYSGASGTVHYVNPDDPSDITDLYLTHGQDITDLYYEDVMHSWAYVDTDFDMLNFVKQALVGGIEIGKPFIVSTPDYIASYTRKDGNQYIFTKLDGTEISQSVTWLSMANQGDLKKVEPAKIYKEYLPEADTSDRIKDTILGGDIFIWTDKELERTESKQKLYDADGHEVSGMALHKYFDDNGMYAGGLFTTSQARPVDEVFGSKTSEGYQQLLTQGLEPKIIDTFITKYGTKVNGDMDISLQVGADSDRTNKIGISISALNAAGIGVDRLSSQNIGIVDDTGDNATDAIDIIADAISKISRQRASLGAVQNRLEHTIKNLDNVVENTTQAESTIRDTDMAEEMVAYSNNNILQQAGQAMLAQANQSNQGILSLLQ